MELDVERQRRLDWNSVETFDPTKPTEPSMNQIQSFIERLRLNADSIAFAEVIDLIDAYYHHTPTAFSNGSLMNQASENQGSAKVLSFARLQGLTEQETLHCFAEHWRSVRSNPNDADHQNIRQFMQNGWDSVELPEGCLTIKGH